MTPEEKIINLIREDLIKAYREEFLELSEKEQMYIICDELQKYFNYFKNGGDYKTILEKNIY